jgi:hypothetical protein
MPPKQEPLTRKGEPSHKTRSGLEIPVPSRDEFFGGLSRAASRPSAASARRAKGKPRTPRDR